MSLDCYESEQVVHYSADHAATYYGFRVSGYSSADCFPFNSAEQRAAFVAAVAPDDPMVAALACVAVLGDEYEREPWAQVLSDRYPEQEESALEAAEKFAETL